MLQNEGAGDKNRKKWRVSLNRKFLWGFILVALVLVLSFSYMSYKIINSMTLQMYTQRVAETAGMAAAIVDGDELLKCLETGEYGEAFQVTMKRLDDIKAGSDMMYLYTFTIDSEGITYIYSARTENDPPDTDVYIGERDSFEGGSSAMESAFTTGKVSETLAVEESHWGYLASAFAPIYNAKGEIVALMGADYSMDDITADIYSRMFRLIPIVLAVIVVIIAIYLLFLRRNLIQPLGRLSASMSEFVSDGSENADGTLDFIDPNIRTNDELRDLSDAYREMVGNLNSYMLNLQTVTADKEKIMAELNVAKSIQMMFLPKIFPPFTQSDPISIFASMRPAKDVGGDFYDFYTIDDDHWCITIADVSGKGVPAALFMVIAKTILKNIALTGRSPADIMTDANNQLTDSNDENMFVTVFLGIFEISTGKFVFCNAGHNPPMISRAGGQFEWLKTRRQLVLAAMPGIRYKQEEITIGNGDRLYLYTDGVSEAMNPDNELYGEDRMLRDVNSVPMTPRTKPTELLAAYRTLLEAHVNGAEQSDDITMMMLHYMD